MPRNERAGLHREMVVETAEQLVDRDGWAALTITGVAKKLGVRGPSLYSHVESIEALLGDVQAKALRDLGAALQRSVMGRSGRDGLAALATALREFAGNHPGRYELAMSEPIDRPAMIEAGRAAGEALGAVMGSFGVATVPHELAFGVLSTLHGVLALHRGGLYARTQLDIDAVYERAVDLVVYLVEQAADGGTA
jgi:AcrR family transcriptional regulator